ncbi:MAG: hypothetical protein KAS94_02735 [Desulfobulbaceae bacterium]|nr:hypothetical protein [Desulfobulbaceae bacterium]
MTKASGEENAGGATHPPSDPNAGVGDPTDGRDAHDWKSKYSPEARKEINHEAIAIVFTICLVYVILLMVWKGWACLWLSITIPEKIIIFNRYAYFGLSGLLGGTVFSMKYLYRTAARGWWHQDRKLWRMTSPLVGMVLAFVVGAMIDSRMLPTNGSISASYAISIGFLVGYFADQAIAKMYEVAMVVFGTSATTKTGDVKK